MKNTSFHGFCLMGKVWRLYKDYRYFQLDRSQCSYSSREAFPCESDSASKKSFYKPKSVHKLRPGDLDVVAGLGDGLVAASGALSSTHGES